jgi:hypothetical protein
MTTRPALSLAFSLALAASASALYESSRHQAHVGRINVGVLLRPDISVAKTET